ncbi:MAG TPA: ATP-binding protein [Polyangiaceae bacterium]|jgi:signal transduction histidine kinase
MESATEKTLDDLTLGSGIELKDLVDREALAEMVQSFFELFQVPLRVYGEQGALLAGVAAQPELYGYLNTLKQGRAALQAVVAAVKNLEPGPEGKVTHTCVTGALYRVTAIYYDGRRIGRTILGPFVPPTLAALPASLLALGSELDTERARELLVKMPRVREQTVSQIARHLAHTLDLILFSGHRALLTSSMHLASVRENFRELQDKNAKLQQAYDRLKELDRLKSNFLATVSHELRTPLTSIIGYSEMLSEGMAGDLSGEQLEFIQTIHEKGEQLLELIKGLLDLSKLESGTMSLRKRNVEMGALVEDVAQTITPAAHKKGVELGVHVEAGLPALWADPDRLRQVLLNLTENALKFTPQGGRVALSAAVCLLDDDKDGDAEGHVVLLTSRRLAIELRIADSGIGIPEEERSRVFDAFYQVDSSSTREQGGTGLGLSIVKRLVDAHDGSVRIEANQPSGTVFVVVIPCRRSTLA